VLRSGPLLRHNYFSSLYFSSVDALPVNLFLWEVVSSEVDSFTHIYISSSRSHNCATVCKTVRPMLSDRCLSCLSVLSVTLVYCGQAVAWIKMKLVVEVGFGRATCVRWGWAQPPPIFGPYLLWPNYSMDQDATWYGGRHQPRRHCVTWGPSFPAQKMGAQPHSSPPPTIRPMYCGQMAGWIQDMPVGMDYGGRPQPRPHCIRWGPSSFPPKKEAQPPPIYGSCLLWPNRRISHLLLSACFSTLSLFVLCPL